MLFITEISFLGLYEVDWHIDYEELKEEPVVKPNLDQIQILTKVILLLPKYPPFHSFFQESKKTGTMKTTRSYGKMVKYRTIAEANVRILVTSSLNFFRLSLVHGRENHQCDAYSRSLRHTI